MNDTTPYLEAQTAETKARTFALNATGLLVSTANVGLLVWLIARAVQAVQG